MTATSPLSKQSLHPKETHKKGSVSRAFEQCIKKISEDNEPTANQIRVTRHALDVPLMTNDHTQAPHVA